MPGPRKLAPTALCYVLLALITVAVYLPVKEAGFVTFDDTSYVTSNPTVQAGLTGEGVRWAFMGAHAANWHPLSWLSHMLDCQLYGPKPAGHHLTSLAFHILNTLLLFGLLRGLTGAFWRCAVVAALFALHPLHVESVAWVAERKDVLSTFFFLLTLMAYARYVECGVRNAECGMKTTTLGRPAYFLLSLACFALGLMSKPMVVTVPFVLLLLDYWPLGRIAECGVRSAESRGSNGKPLANLLVEKLPFFALSLASCVVTLIAQRQGGAMSLLEGSSAVSLESRLINTPIAYVWYLVKLVWPSNLAVIYPFVRQWPTAQVLAVSALLLFVTLAAISLRRKHPYVLVGWLWYLGTLVPVIGLVKVGVQSIADRYMYIPSIGLFVLVAWGVADLAAGLPRRPLALAAVAVAVLMIYAAMTCRQLSYWQNTETLFRHTLAVTRGNYVACNILGAYFAQQGQHEAATQYYESAISIAPDYAGARNNLGATLVCQQHFAEAVAALEAALKLKPESVDIQRNLAAALSGLAGALAGQHKTQEAVQRYRAALKLAPDLPEALNNLAWILAANPDDAVRNGAEAVALAEHACRLTDYKQPQLVGTLGAAYAEAGRFAEAVAMADKAKLLAEQSNQKDLAARNQALRELYVAGRPARDTL